MKFTKYVPIYTCSSVCIEQEVRHSLKDLTEIGNYCTDYSKAFTYI